MCQPCTPQATWSKYSWVSCYCWRWVYTAGVAEYLDSSELQNLELYYHKLILLMPVKIQTINHSLLAWLLQPGTVQIRERNGEILSVITHKIVGEKVTEKTREEMCYNNNKTYPLELISCAVSVSLPSLTQVPSLTPTAGNISRYS